jgi:two-component system, OmpR family, response regulator
MLKRSNELNLFLVDDDKLFLTSLTHQLQSMFSEAKIQTFATGEEFLKQLHNKPGIVILDYYLNGSYKDAMNGIDVLKRIMNESPDTKVIMLSAQEKMEIAADSIKYGAYDYITKNENVFMRTRLSIINAADALSVSKELKSFKSVLKVVAGLIVLIITCCILLQKYYPEISGNPGLK